MPLSWTRPCFPRFASLGKRGRSLCAPSADAKVDEPKDCNPVPMTETTTLAHISDVHLSPISGFTPRHWNIKRGLGFLNWQRGRRFVHSTAIAEQLIEDMMLNEPDHVAVTGDLINIGLPREYEAARRWLESVGPPDRVTVVPGNHDIYTRLRADIGVKRWAPYMTADRWGSLAQLKGRDGFPFLRRVGPVALIALNSAVPTPPFVAAGRLGPEQIAGLAHALDLAADAGLIRVVLIHHPPLVGQAPSLRGLSDCVALGRVLAEHGAELILHGHNHQNSLQEVMTRRGPMLVAGICSGSAARRHHGEPVARYHLLHFSQAAGRVRIELTARGFEKPDGGVVELERRVLATGG